MSKTISVLMMVMLFALVAAGCSTNQTATANDNANAKANDNATTTANATAPTS